MFLSDAIPSRLWEYLIATILIILAPGPSVLFTIARAIAWGRVAAIATVIGNAAGMFLISVLVALGLGPILQSSKLFYNGIQWAGGGYLKWLLGRHIKSKINCFLRCNLAAICRSREKQCHRSITSTGWDFCLSRSDLRWSLWRISWHHQNLVIR